MADSIILTLGSPIKDHLAPSMLGPAGAKVAASSISGGSSAATLTAGTSTALTAMHGTAAGVGTTAAVAATGLFFSLLSVAATVAVAYVTYRGVKALLD